MLVIAIACVFGASFLVLSALTANRALVQAQLRRAASAGAYAVESGSELDGNARERMLVPIFERLAQVGLRMTPRGSIEEVRAKLRGAGMGNVNPTSFLAAKAGFAIGGVALGVLMMRSAPGMGVFMMIGGAVGAFLLPDYLLTVRTRIRKESLVSQMPNVLDLLTVSVEAGLGFDAAMVRVAKNGHGVLAAELIRTLQDIQVGQTRRQAYEDLVERTQVPDLKQFIRSIIQAEAYGLALSSVLNTQAAEMRMKRRMRAEQKAMQIPVKVIFPLMLCILPVLFMVVMGPGVIGIISAFK